jgi:hypothetical protein
MEIVDLNLIPGDTFPACHVSQYDKGRQIRLNLFDGTSVYTLSGNETVSLHVRKPDNHIVTASVTNTSSNYVIISTTEQMTACYGKNMCEIKIVTGQVTLGTLNFIMEVEEDPLCSGASSYYAAQDLIRQVNDIVNP